MENKDTVGKFFIIKDIQFTDFMKNESGDISLYDTYDDASFICFIQELENCLICEVKSNSVEPEYDDASLNDLNDLFLINKETI